MKKMKKIAGLTSLAALFAVVSAGGAYANVASTDYVDRGLATKSGKAPTTDSGQIAAVTATGEFAGSGVTAAQVTGAVTTVNNLQTTVNNLGTAATMDASQFATAAQGTLADSAVQPAALANYIQTNQKGVANGVATLGANGLVPDTQLPAETQSNWNETSTTSPAYIQNKPTAVSAFTNDAGFITAAQVPAETQSNWTETNAASPAYIQNKPTLATVATTGAFSDLTGAPATAQIPPMPSTCASGDCALVTNGTALVWENITR